MKLLTLVAFSAFSLTPPMASAQIKMKYPAATADSPVSAPANDAAPASAATIVTVTPEPTPSAEPATPPPVAYPPPATEPAPKAAAYPTPAAIQASAPIGSVALASPVEMPAPAATTDTHPGFDSKMSWRIQSGERISDAFVRWAHTLGWQVSWEPDDLIAQTDLELNDTLTGAVTKVIDALNQGGANIRARFYASNHMLRIMARK
ncbi:MAG: toxin co-regulated pilus biosynthesis Q family protein [Sterolibacterium sp.]|nr:toxin co-regulated pilus biosynthesis Q family protein [Sterolibacterium sp.]